MRRAPSRNTPASSGGVSDAGSSPARIEVPKTNTDPVWSLCSWPVTISVDNIDFESPAAPAADWLQFLMASPNPDLWGMVDEMFPGLEDHFFEHEKSPTELIELIKIIITTVGARPYWVTLRLIGVLRQSWHILGPKMITQVDATRVSLSAWLDVSIGEMVGAMEPSQTMMFSLQLTTPPPGEEEDPDTMKQLEMDQSTFLAMAQ